MSVIREEIELYIKNLNNALKNLKKALNRRYKKDTLLNKIEQTRSIYKLAILEHAISSEEIFFFLNCSRNIFGDIHTIIATKLEQAYAHNISLPAIVYALKFTSK